MSDRLSPVTEGAIDSHVLIAGGECVETREFCGGDSLALNLTWDPICVVYCIHIYLDRVYLRDRSLVHSYCSFVCQGRVGSNRNRSPSCCR